MEDKGAKEVRGSWSSRFGFIMAAAGSAIGLGNLWGFPYKLGANGGAVYLFIYVILVFVVGCVVILGEIAIGRKTQLSAVGAYRSFGKRYSILGYAGIVCGFIILSFYSVVASWGIKYFFTYFGQIFTGQHIQNSGEFLTSFISGTAQPLFYHGLIMAVTVFIVALGIQKGIDKTTSVLMPMLFVMLVILAIRSLMLPNAAEGLKFMFKPDFSVLKDGGFGKVLSAALSQVFFSLSIGMGVMLTYGSYLKKDTNLVKSSLIIPIMDTVAAILAGIVIMPAVFSYGLDPTGGPTLLFVVMGEVFASMPFGSVIGCVFYLLVVFAAVTSTISILEGITAFFVDEKGTDRKKAAIISGIAIFLCGIPVALSFGLLSDVTLPALNGSQLPILDWYDYVSEYVIMTLGALAMCILVGWVWKPKVVIDEVTRYNDSFKLAGVWSFLIKYITPVLVLLTFLTSAGFIKL